MALASSQSDTIIALQRICMRYMTLWTLSKCVTCVFLPIFLCDPFGCVSIQPAISVAKPKNEIYVTTSVQCSEKRLDRLNKQKADFDPML